MCACVWRWAALRHHQDAARFHPCSSVMRQVRWGLVLMQHGAYGAGEGMRARMRVGLRVEAHRCPPQHRSRLVSFDSPHPYLRCRRIMLNDVPFTGATFQPLIHLQHTSTHCDDLRPPKHTNPACLHPQLASSATHLPHTSHRPVPQAPLRTHASHRAPPRVLALPACYIV